MSPQLVLAAIYSRISHDPEGRALGVERQEQDCRALIVKRGWTAVEPPYRENDTPASTLTKTKRPIYDQLLTDVRTGKVNVIVSYSTSRLTRRPAEYDQLISLFKTSGLRVETVVSGIVDLATADGRAMARVLAAMDCAEAERTGERIARAALQRAERGDWHGGGIPPYGYDYRRSDGRLRLVVNPTRAGHVREAADRVLAGESLYRVCEDFNSRGLQTALGKLWRSQQIRRMLIGSAVIGHSERNAQLFPGYWTPILERDTWDALRLLLLDPARNTRTFDQAAHRYPLAGLVFCALCGHGMTSNTVRYGLTWLCSTRSNGGCGHVRIRGVDLERHVLEEIALRPAGLQGLAPSEGQKVSDLQEQLHRIQDDYYDHLLDHEAFIRQTERFRQRIANARRDATTTSMRGLPSTTVEDSEDGRRRLLRHHIDRITIDRHPRGVSSRPGTDWASRKQNMAHRARIIWTRQDSVVATSTRSSSSEDASSSL